MSLDDPALPDDAALRDLLAAAEGAGAALPPDLEDDPAALLAALARAGDDPALRRALGEVAADIASLEEARLEEARLEEAVLEEAALSPHVRRAAMEAFALRRLAASEGAAEAPVASPARAARAPARQASRRAPADRPRRRVRAAWAGAMRVAAMLLLAFGVAHLLRSDGEAAAGGLALRGIDHIDAGAGLTAWEGPRRLAPGTRLAAQPRPGSRLALHLAGDGGVLLEDGDVLEVARLDHPAWPAARDGVLRLVGGEARLLATDEPVALALDAGALLVLEQGAAHVALAAEAPGAPAAPRPPAVALARGAHAVLHRFGGHAPIPLHGPTHVLLAAGDGGDPPLVLGAPARSLFRDLAFFGGPLAPPSRTHRVGARRWRVVEGHVRRRGGRLSLLPPAPDSAALLAWRPGVQVRAATALELDLRGPAGLVVEVVPLGVRAVLAPPADAATGPAASTAPPEAPTAPETALEAEPGVGGVALALPEGWYARLEAGQELGLRLTWPLDEAPTPVTFDGAGFGFADPLRHPDLRSPER